jgi:hypothetical protein
MLPPLRRRCILAARWMRLEKNLHAQEAQQAQHLFESNQEAGRDFYQPQQYCSSTLPGCMQHS